MATEVIVILLFLDSCLFGYMLIMQEQVPESFCVFIYCFVHINEKSVSGSCDAAALCLAIAISGICWAFLPLDFALAVPVVISSYLCSFLH